MKEFAKLTGEYKKWIDEEIKKTKEEFIVSSVGKLNPKNHLLSGIEENLNTNVMECMGNMINAVVFWNWSIYKYISFKDIWLNN